MENPLWHDSLTFERLLEQRLQHSPTTGVRLSHDEVRGLAKQLELMRKQLPPGEDVKPDEAALTVERNGRFD